MSAAAIIQIDQVRSSGTSFGTPGVSRDAMWKARRVNLTSTQAASTYLWTLVVPDGSGATLTGPTTSTPFFVPDVDGTYLFQLDVDGGSPGGGAKTQRRLIRVTLDTNGLALPGVVDMALPAFQEGLSGNEANYGSNTLGWAEVWKRNFNRVRELLRTVYLSVSTLSALAAISDATIPDGQMRFVVGDFRAWQYSASGGANIATDNTTCVRPTSLATSSPGSWFPVTTAPVVPTMAAFALHAPNWNVVHVKGYYLPGDGGGGTWDKRPTSTLTANGGNVVTVGGVCFVRRTGVVEELDSRQWGVVDDHTAAVAGVSTPETVNQVRGQAMFDYAYTLTAQGYTFPTCRIRGGLTTVGQNPATYTGGSVVGRRVTYGWSIPSVEVVGQTGSTLKTTGSGYSILQINGLTTLSSLTFDSCDVGVQLTGWGTYGAGGSPSPGPAAILISTPIFINNCTFAQHCTIGVWRDKTPLSAPSNNRSMQSLLVFNNCKWIHSRHAVWIDNDQVVFHQPMFAMNQTTGFEVDTLGFPLGFVNHAQGHCKIVNPIIELEGDTVGTRSAFFVGKSLWDVYGAVEFDLNTTTVFRLRSADNTYQGIGEAAQFLDGDDPPGGIVLTNCYFNTNSKNVAEIYGKLPTNFIVKSCTYGSNLSAGITINSDTVTFAEMMAGTSQFQNWQWEREDWARVKYAAEAHMLDPVGTGGVSDVTGLFTWLVRPTGTEQVDYSTRINLHTVNTEASSDHVYDPLASSPTNISGVVSIDTTTGYRVRLFTVSGGVGAMTWDSGNLADFGPRVCTYAIEVNASDDCDLFFAFFWDGVQSSSRYYRVLKGRRTYWITFFMPSLSGGHTMKIGARLEAMPNGMTFWRAFPTISTGYGPSPWTTPVDNGASPTTNLQSAIKRATYQQATVPSTGAYGPGDRVWVDAPTAGGTPVLAVASAAPHTFIKVYGSSGLFGDFNSDGAQVRATQFRLGVDDAGSPTWTPTAISFGSNLTPGASGGARFYGGQSASGTGNGDGGLTTLAAGSANGTGVPGGVGLAIGLASGIAYGMSVQELANSGRKVWSLGWLAFGALPTGTNMPVNTGDGVGFLADATSDPTTGLPSGGAIVWSSAAGGSVVRVQGASGAKYDVSARGSSVPGHLRAGESLLYELAVQTSSATPATLLALDLATFGTGIYMVEFHVGVVNVTDSTEAMIAFQAGYKNRAGAAGGLAFPYTVATGGGSVDVTVAQGPGSGGAKVTDGSAGSVVTWTATPGAGNTGKSLEWAGWLKVRKLSYT